MEHRQGKGQRGQADAGTYRLGRVLVLWVDKLPDHAVGLGQGLAVGRQPHHQLVDVARERGAAGGRVVDVALGEGAAAPEQGVQLVVLDIDGQRAAAVRPVMSWERIKPGRGAGAAAGMGGPRTRLVSLAIAPMASLALRGTAIELRS